MEGLKNWNFVGVDLGQARDYTAIAVVERAQLVGEWDPAAWAYKKKISLRLRYLERVALGTPYPEVAQEVVRVTTHPDLAGQCDLVVDATGVGRPVVDLLRRADPRCTLIPVTITAGEHEGRHGGYHHVPKRDLISNLQVLLQRGELKIAKGLRNAPELVKEMSEMRVKITAAGNEQTGV
jgi:hypothetical protein